MSREIKFRAWSNEHNRYCDFVTLDENGRWIGWIKSNGVYLTTLDIVLEQDTGLKDKNGKKICEGDIVKMPDWRLKPKFEVVRFTKLSCGFEPFVCGCMECWAPDGEEVEVIGNMHENPELLEDNK